MQYKYEEDEIEEEIKYNENSLDSYKTNEDKSQKEIDDMEKYKYRSMNIMFNVMVMYGVKNSIFSLRELEYRIKQDYVQ